jgi:flagellin-specific chaperone FliS
MKNDTAIVAEVVDLMKQIKQAWDAIADTARPEQGHPAA